MIYGRDSEQKALDELLDAAQLFLSPRTVGHHLYKIFPKLGIASRSQLRELDL